MTNLFFCYMQSVLCSSQKLNTIIYNSDDDGDDDNNN